MRTKLKKKTKERKRVKYEAPTARAAVTNGRTLDPMIDGRSAYARRVRDVIRNHADDLGGDRVLSQAQRALIRRAAFLQAELEKREVKFALSDGASRLSLEHYQRATNTLRRVLLALGIERKSSTLKNITPTKYKAVETDIDTSDYEETLTGVYHGPPIIETEDGRKFIMEEDDGGYMREVSTD
jgi:hypothetical protein